MTAPGPPAVALSEIAAGLPADLGQLPLSAAPREKLEIEESRARLPRKAAR